MNRAANILAALVVWAVSSGLLFFICVFSVNQTIISAALIIPAVSLIGSAIAFAMKHDKLAFGLAAGPAIVIGGILVMFAGIAVYSGIHYHR